MAAVTTREPLNANPKVELDAGASPNQLSDVQYLTNACSGRRRRQQKNDCKSKTAVVAAKMRCKPQSRTMLALANGFVLASVPKTPSCAKRDFHPLEDMSNLSVL